MMEFSFGILSETSPISYHRSHSPEFDPDAETDQAPVNSDDSAETVTVEVTKTPPMHACLEAHHIKLPHITPTQLMHRKKRILLRRGKTKMLHNLQEKLNADTKVSPNLCPSLFQFKEA